MLCMFCDTMKNISLGEPTLLSTLQLNLLNKLRQFRYKTTTITDFKNRGDVSSLELLIISSYSLPCDYLKGKGCKNNNPVILP